MSHRPLCSLILPLSLESEQKMKEYPSETRQSKHILQAVTKLFFIPGAHRNVAQAFAVRNEKRTYLDCWTPEMIEPR